MVPVRAHRSFRRRALGAFGAAVVAGSLIGVVPAAAATPTPTPGGGGDRSSAASGTPAPTPAIRPGDDHMGSTLPGRGSGDGSVPRHFPDARHGAMRPRDGAPATLGMDVSNYQGDVDWSGAARGGAKFAYVKATESTTYQNPSFAAQLDGAGKAGLVRGAYHFALPDHSSGAAQAEYFVAHGGTWTNDGRTLPPMLDIEYNPYGPTCYGLSPHDMSTWLADFSDTVHARTGRFPTIYTTTDWWNTCTGGNPDFAPNNPLFVARYADTPEPMPAGWPWPSFWQFSDTGGFPGDQDLWNGSPAALTSFASR